MGSDGVAEHVVVVHGRRVYPADLELVRRVASERWGEGLSSITSEVCRLWAWRRSDGSLSVELGERVLVTLADLGLVELPPADRKGRRRRRRGVAPPPLEIDTSPLVGRLCDYGFPCLKVVRESAAERLWSGLVGRYHYLGERVTIGKHLKYLARIGGRPVGALLWGPAVLKLAARDRWIGWSPCERQAGLCRIANNHRFLIPPWVRIRHLASHLLAANLRRLSGDWEEAFGHGLDLVETFVDPDRFEATSYVAANWIPVGMTQGSGRRNTGHHYHGHRKLILLYPLKRAWRTRHPGRSPPFTLAAALAHRAPERIPLPEWQRREQETEGGEQEMIGVAPCSTEKPEGDIPQADLETMAEEFVAYHESFRDVFSWQRQWKHMDAYVCALLSPRVGRKNAEQVALYGPSQRAVRTLQGFLTDSPWSDEAVRVRHQELVAGSLGEPDGVLIVDGCGIPKKGKESAGVARQYCGATGKIDNCQMGVFAAYAGRRGGTVIDGTLYMPESWFTEEQNKKRWKGCRIPEDLQFTTKPQLALSMIQAVYERGQLPARWVLGDEDFGQYPTFLDGIPDAYWYFCEVPSNVRVWASRPETETVPTAEGSPAEIRLKPGEPARRKVRELVEDADLQWQPVIIKEGAKGPIVAEVARLRVIEVRDKLPGKEVWLFLRRNPKTGELKYFLCNAPLDVAMEEMVRICGARWPIETCFQEDKSKVGMDHYEVRSWTGWHHHMTLVMLAHHFLVLMRNRLKKKPRA